MITQSSAQTAAMIMTAAVTIAVSLVANNSPAELAISASQAKLFDSA